MCFTRNGIIDKFSEIYSSDAFSLPKSDPEIYLKLSKLIGCKPEEAVFYDDNISAVKAAKEAGLYTVGVYDISSSDCEEQMKKFSDKYIKSFKVSNQSLYLNVFLSFLFFCFLLAELTLYFVFGTMLGLQDLSSPPGTEPGPQL